MPAAGQDAPAAESSETPEDSPSADVAAPIDIPEAPAPEEPIAAAPVEPEAPEPEPVVAAPIATQPPPVAPAAPIATPAPVAPVAPAAPAAVQNAPVPWLRCGGKPWISGGPGKVDESGLLNSGNLCP